MLDQTTWLKAILFIAILTSSIIVRSECVHEEKLLGAAISEKIIADHDYYLMDDSGRFTPLELSQINPLKVYTIQFIKKTDYVQADFNQYDKKYIKYYRYQHVEDFMQKTNIDFTAKGYEQVIIGKSIEGRNLWGVRPVQLDPNKKTIVMFGRHHGDEGTANWIIEGFVQKFLAASEEFHQQFQIILYPMVNPDGAEAQTRYNKNGRDLNRSWSKNLVDSYDEARTINTDLQLIMSHLKNIVVVLDMHGSFTEDFIYRVDEKYVDRNFFMHQQNFIDTLKVWDQFQGGNFILSNGDPGMARIVMIDAFNLNALTHETPRDIKLKNPKARSQLSLFRQGFAVFNTIVKIY